MGWSKLSSVGTAGTVADIKIIFALALKTNASGIIVSHNHPSHNLTLSDEDRRLTKQIADAASLFEIKLLNYLIAVPSEAYFSFADEGLL